MAELVSTGRVLGTRTPNQRQATVTDPDKIRELREHLDTHESTPEEMEDGHWETEVDDNPNVSISVSLPKTLLDRLRVEARELGVSVFALTRAILEDYIDTTKGPRD